MAKKKIEMAPIFRGPYSLLTHGAHLEVHALVGRLCDGVVLCVLETGDVEGLGVRLVGIRIFIFIWKKKVWNQDFDFCLKKKIGIRLIEIRISIFVWEKKIPNIIMIIRRSCVCYILIDFLKFCWTVCI